MKAIGIKMVDLQSMTANEAIEKGYKTNNYTGETIKQEDIERFIAKESVTTAGSKNTVVTLTTITGFEANCISSCIKPENYDANIGKKFARPHAVDQIWAGLGFVLQWAKYGLTFNE